MAFPLSSPSTPPVEHAAPGAAIQGVSAAFAEAINSRVPVPALVALSSAPSSSSSSPSTTSISSNLRASSFTELPPSALHNVLNDGILILDIRPHHAYSLGRLPGALPLSVPSTLLKRPGFSLEKLAQMLSSSAARERFTEWHDAERIIVYDADSAVLAEGGNVLGLLRKFRYEGYTRDIAFVKGGFHAVWRDVPSLIDTQPPPREDDDDGLPTMSKSVSAPAAAPTLRTRHLPMSAFTLSSTAAASSSSLSSLSQRRTMHLHSLSLSQSQSESIPAHPHLTQVVPSTPVSNRADPFSAMAPPLSTALRLLPAKEGVATTSFPQYSDSTALPTPSPQLGFRSRPHYSSLPPASAVAFNPFFDNVRQNLELQGVNVRSEGGSISAGIPLKLPRRVRRRVGDLPFEWLRQIARKSGKVRIVTTSDEDNAQSATGDDSGGSNSDTTSPSNSSSEDLTRALASQFHRIELSEQKRLMGVMEHHSKESGAILSSGSGSSKLIGQSVSASGHSFPLARPPFSGSALIGGNNVTRSVSYAGAVTGPITGAVHSTIGTLVPSLLDLKDRQKSQREPEEDEAEVPMFPYSITAGIEKGTKNRYRNIWPFEHARVRLMRKLSNGEDDDYMNASYVQPLGTTKRYIATQGPLPATFNDFWALCWEQNVHVIVMLTREVESATVKCGNYWVEGSYGPLRLKLLETSDTPERERERRESESASGFFNFSTPPKPTPGKARPKHKDKKLVTSSLSHAHGEDQEATPPTIRRVFSLTHTGYPTVSPRTVIHLQYLEWPDMNVPDDPQGILRLIREVGIAAASSMKVGDKVWGEGPMSKKDVKSYRDGILSPAGVDSPVVPGVNQEKSGIFDTEPEEPLHNGGAGPEDNTDSDACSSEMDPRTGIAKHALGNPPVLLHCSAGVGRTGGFIAVDAALDGIRREMRKRSEGRTRAGINESDAVLSGSGSQSPLRAGSSSPPRETSDGRSSTSAMGEGEGADPMEVDSTTSPSPPRVQASPSPDLVALPEVQDVVESTATAIPTGLTLPMAAGRNEVHVPVAGFSVPMDVDSASSTSMTGLLSPPATATMLTAPVRPGLPRKSTVTASPELVSEVKRATMLNQILSTASKPYPHGHTHSHPPHPNSPLNTTTGSSALASPLMEIRSPVPHVASNQSALSSRALSEVSSDSNGHSNSRRSMVTASQFGSGTGSTSFGSGSGLGSGISSSASPGASSTTSLLISARTAGLSLGEKKADVQPPQLRNTRNELTPSANNSDRKGTVATADASSASSPSADFVVDASPMLKKSPHTPGILASSSSRLDDWRSEVRNSQTQEDPSARSSGSDEAEFSDLSANSVSRSRVMALPRRLHDDASPHLLSTYDEPIRRLVEDMRQQRMSLCQSLRQYVFVHQAIIEGALMIVDEEREKRHEVESSSLDSDTEMRRVSASSSVGSFSPVGEEPTGSTSSHGAFASAFGQMAAGSGLGPAFVLKDDVITRKSVAVRHPSLSESVSSAATSPAAASASPGRSKRGASPTELLKEGTTGEVLLTKRPSIKRRQRSSDEEEQVHRVKHVHTDPPSASHVTHAPHPR